MKQSYKMEEEEENGGGGMNRIPYTVVYSGANDVNEEDPEEVSRWDRSMLSD